MHVVQPPFVRSIAANSAGALQIRALFRTAVGMLTVTIGLPTRQGAAKRKGSRCAGTTRVFPFCLRRQAILLAFFLAQTIAEIDGINPAHLLNREPAGVESFDSVVGFAASVKRARVRAQ